MSVQSKSTKNINKTHNLPFELKVSSALTAHQYLELRRAHKISTFEYVTDCIKQIEIYEPQVQAWCYFDKNRLLDLAKKCDAVKDIPDNHHTGFDGRMWGVPVAVKDVFNTEDMPTEHGSPLFKNYHPGNDARVVTSLKREGALMAGKVVTAEFAVHTPGITKNPYDHARTPGTSSSGSAVAVALGMTPVALASQTGGSTIRPASFCGIVGFKPSFGVLPRTAMLKTTDTLDTVGLMARSVDDVGLMFDICRVKDRNYPLVYREYQKMERLSIGDRPWRVGFINGPKSTNQSAALQRQMTNFEQQLIKLGCEVKQYQMPEISDEAHDQHSLIYNKSLAYYFKREWAIDKSQFSPRLSEMICEGIQTPYSEYDDALKYQNRLAEAFDRLLAENCDILIDVSANDEAPFEHDMHIKPDHDLIYTMGLMPALSLPLFKSDNSLPIGAQFVARRFDDYKLLYFAQFIEEHFLKS